MIVPQSFSERCTMPFSLRSVSDLKFDLLQESPDLFVSNSLVLVPVNPAEGSIRLKVLDLGKDLSMAFNIQFTLCHLGRIP